VAHDEHDSDGPTNLEWLDMAAEWRETMTYTGIVLAIVVGAFIAYELLYFSTGNFGRGV
jgi:hypothetical protein